MSRTSNSRRRGFTIIEVLIVLGVISILASIALVSLSNALDKAKQRATMADMRTISRSIEAYSVDNNIPPQNSGAVSGIVTNLRPYYSNVIPTQDSWKNDLIYSADVTGAYTIESYGKDGINGTDITISTRFSYDLDIVIFNGMFVATPE
ncbi:MAG: prepilin-type N-terminal cleavage/methylation domain-containing protein [bacterium]|nr:prepilin-type N-terminal cleavage/methylation domain-containing protein [bacterium]